MKKLATVIFGHFYFVKRRLKITSAVHFSKRSPVERANCPSSVRSPKYRIDFLFQLVLSCRYQANLLQVDLSRGKESDVQAHA